ncbi:MAG: methylenetetrahydrofolate reductase [Alphaproteobacteria bacterium]
MEEPSAIAAAPRAAAALPALLANVSLEVSTRRAADVEACRDGFAPGTEVYITSLPGDAPADTTRTAAALARAGLVPVPHVAARRLADAAAADALLARLAGEAGVTRALVIAGDTDTPAGPFASAASLLASGLFARQGFRAIGVAGYPEGHPRITDEALTAALGEKLALLAAQGIAAHVVTQFCFEATPIRRWLVAYAAAGHAAPVRLGIAGPAGLATLTRYALRCGIGSSARALARHGARFTRLAREATPDALLADLAATPLPVAAGIHLFTFGGVERTAAWLASARGG